MTRRAVLASALSALAKSRMPDSPRPVTARADRMIDLTHPLSPASPFITVKDATFPFQREPIATIPLRGVYANRWALTEHIGTHLDAPCHFAEQSVCVSAIPLEDLFADAVVIDVSRRAANDPDTELTVADLDRWIAEHGPLPARCDVLLHSGWDARWPSQLRFSNIDADGTMHFPGFSRGAMERLALAPDVLGVGTDTFSIDPGLDSTYAGHKVLAAAGKWALECVKNLGQLPPRGARIFIGAIPVEAASGSPARVVAWSPV
jgi:kynurenine formamidase